MYHGSRRLRPRRQRRSPSGLLLLPFLLPLLVIVVMTRSDLARGEPAPRGGAGADGGSGFPGLDGMPGPVTGSHKPPPNALKRTDIFPDFQQKYAQLRQLQADMQGKLLTVPDPDRRRCDEFLKKLDTGVIMLLPRGMYETVVDLRGGGAYYSFVLKTHEYGHGSDIELSSEGRLTCGFAGRDYGYFLPLGDVAPDDLASLVAAAPPAKVNLPAGAGGAAGGEWSWQEMWSDTPVDSSRVRNVESRNFAKVPGVDGRGVSAGAGKSFLLRSVSPSRSDVLVAFRILDEFDDGSIVLAWKLLKSYGAHEEPGREQQRRLMLQRMQQLQQQRQQQMAVPGRAPARP
jgi:hypothetical protein